MVEDVRCEKCDFKLAVTDGERIDIKRKDLLVLVFRGDVTIRCPRCKTMNRRTAEIA